MTKQELNRDFKRLHKAFKNQQSGDATRWTNKDTTRWTNKDWQDYQDQRDNLKKELIRLYDASDEFFYANRLSILIFMEINNSIRAISFHQVRVRITKS